MAPNGNTFDVSSLAWTPLYFFLATGTLLAIGLGGPLHWVFPIGAAMLAYVLYRRAPVTYVSFVWWLWFLSPFIRRIVDFRSGWVDPSPILLAAPLASLACLPTLKKHQELLWQPSARPFLLALAGTLYGVGIGLLRSPARTVAVDALSWLTPLVFGFHCYCVLRNQEDFARYASAIGSTFRWGALLVGAYGVVQFVTAPGWDCLWMTESQMTSIGTPEPFAIRVFSTMNAPGPLGFMLAAALVLLITQTGWIAKIASTFGYLALALSSARSAWLVWLVAVAILGVRNKKYLASLIVTAALIGVCFVSLPEMGVINQSIQTRIQTFQNMQDDQSYLDRREGFSRMVEKVVAQPLGEGIGSVAGDDQIGEHDNAFIELFLSLGWFGALAYLSALVLTARHVLRSRFGSAGLVYAANGIFVGMLCALCLGSVMLSSPGIVLWSCIAISLAFVPATKHKDAASARSFDLITQFRQP
jgi:hypothetical protein